MQPLPEIFTIIFLLVFVVSLSTEGNGTDQITLGDFVEVPGEKEPSLPAKHQSPTNSEESRETKLLAELLESFQGSQDNQLNDKIRTQLQKTQETFLKNVYHATTQNYRDVKLEKQHKNEQRETLGIQFGDQLQTSPVEKELHRTEKGGRNRFKTEARNKAEISTENRLKIRVTEKYLSENEMKDDIQFHTEKRANQRLHYESQSKAEYGENQIMHLAEPNDSVPRLWTRTRSEPSEKSPLASNSRSFKIPPLSSVVGRSFSLAKQTVTDHLDKLDGYTEGRLSGAKQVFAGPIERLRTLSKWRRGTGKPPTTAQRVPSKRETAVDSDDPRDDRKPMFTPAELDAIAKGSYQTQSPSWTNERAPTSPQRRPDTKTPVVANDWRDFLTKEQLEALNAGTDFTKWGVQTKKRAPSSPRPKSPDKLSVASIRSDEIPWNARAKLPPKEANEMFTEALRRKGQGDLQPEDGHKHVPMKIRMDQIPEEMLAKWASEGYIPRGKHEHVPARMTSDGRVGPLNPGPRVSKSSDFGKDPLAGIDPRDSATKAPVMSSDWRDLLTKEQLEAFNAGTDFRKWGVQSDKRAPSNPRPKSPDKLNVASIRSDEIPWNARAKLPPKEANEMFTEALRRKGQGGLQPEDGHKHVPVKVRMDQIPDEMLAKWANEGHIPRGKHEHVPARMTSDGFVVPLNPGPRVAKSSDFVKDPFAGIDPREAESAFRDAARKKNQASRKPTVDYTGKTVKSSELRW